MISGLHVELPPPGDCKHYIKREKRDCENPATWTAEYTEKGRRVKKTVCQLHAKLYHKQHNARVARIMPIGELAVESRPEMPHCPGCGASTVHPVLKDGKPVCPFCASKVGIV